MSPAPSSDPFSSLQQLQTVLIVGDRPSLGDQESLIDFIANCLNGRHFVEILGSIPAMTDRLLSAPPPDLILLRPDIAGADGYHACLRLKAGARTSLIPVMFFGRAIDPADQARALTVGAADVLTAPFHPDLVRARISQQLELKRHREKLENLVAAHTEEILRTQEAALLAIVALAETRDQETGGHLYRTQNYVQLLAEELAKDPRYAPVLDDKTIEWLWKSAPLHDVGKVGISDHILLKPGPLTPEEFAEVKKHTLYGWHALKGANQRMGQRSFLRLAAEMALTHHEKWDGSGYPHGVAGEKIPLSGRIMALADVYDALISRRVYKKSFRHEDAVQIITHDSGRHFDPNIVEAFLRIERKIAAVVLASEEYAI